MTTQPESGMPQPESGSTQSESGVTQSQYGESKEGKSSSSLSTRWSWPRDLSDLWSGWQPLGAMNWPFRDIKVEEFIDGDQLVVRAEVPGVDPEEDIDVSVENDVLTISAERRESNRGKMGDRGFHSEFRYGSFVRQVRLPAGTSPEVVSATYKDGVLEIRMPKPSGSEGVSRRVQIQRG
ncbi:MAG: Hsp20/alpha crystallin family protein [Propionibacteriaceae bacterium]|jgi:HSP20 family protein